MGDPTIEQAANELEHYPKDEVMDVFGG